MEVGDSLRRPVVRVRNESSPRDLPSDLSFLGEWEGGGVNVARIGKSPKRDVAVDVTAVAVGSDRGLMGAEGVAEEEEEEEEEEVEEEVEEEEDEDEEEEEAGKEEKEDGEQYDRVLENELAS